MSPSKRCWSADSRKDLVVLMYHMHIPLPDPMANPSTIARRDFYGFRGVPTYFLDGELMKTGGGSRDMAQGLFDGVSPKIEQLLETPAEARLSLKRRARRGDAGQRQSRRQPDQRRPQGGQAPACAGRGNALVQRRERHCLHPVVVRSLAGEGHGGFAVDAAKPAAVEHIFDLAAITDELKTHLEEYEAKLPAERKFSQKKHEINPNESLGRGLCAGPSIKKILQAAYVRLKSNGVAANR